MQVAHRNYTTMWCLWKQASINKVRIDDTHWETIYIVSNNEILLPRGRYSKLIRQYV